MPAPRPSDGGFDAAFALWVDPFHPSKADARFPRRSNAVSTTSVTPWMPAYQRMHPDMSLDAAVKHLLACRPTLLPDHKRVRENTRSSNASGDRDARPPPPAGGVPPRRPKAHQFRKRKPRPPADDPST